MNLLFLLIPLFFYGCATATDYSKVRENYIANHPDISEQTKEDIRNGTYRIGMTEEQVQVVLGLSDFVLQNPESRTCNALGCSETINDGGIYLTFIDGKLASFYQSSSY